MTVGEPATILRYFFDYFHVASKISGVKLFSLHTLRSFGTLAPVFTIYHIRTRNILDRVKGQVMVGFLMKNTLRSYVLTDLSQTERKPP